MGKITHKYEGQVKPLSELKGRPAKQVFTRDEYDLTTTFAPFTLALHLPSPKRAGSPPPGKEKGFTPFWDRREEPKVGFLLSASLGLPVGL